jgi:hypothetical protein
LIASRLPGWMTTDLDPLSHVVCDPWIVQDTGVSAPSRTKVNVREQFGDPVQEEFGG